MFARYGNCARYRGSATKNQEAAGIPFLSRLTPARRAKADTTVQDLIDEFRPAVDELKTLVPGALSPFEQKAVARRAKAFVQSGAP